MAEAQSRTAAILVESQARATAISTEKTERQAADGNLSQRIDTVSAASAGNAAAIQQEVTARANADSALSSRIDTTAATAAGNTAAITAEQTARANADSALSSRIDTVTASAANNAAAITAEQTARANADSALTQRVDSLQAQAGMFDAVLNYGFDAGLEGWSATRLTLAVGGGVITATATGTSAYLSSPSNLAIEGKTATKVRMRITRRAGSGWLGYVTYATANHGSSSAYRKIVANPGLAVGQSAIVEWDMAALTTGGTDWVDSTITRFHIWLTGTVDDVFEIDWIAVGKESPAASTASLLAEQQARAAGDTANAQAITAAESRITNTETQQAAQATALSGLTTRVSSVEGQVSSNSSSITSLTNSVSTADQKAVTAQQAAQDAATLAGSKGKVIVQSSAPATADRQAQNLWIDTTNNANTPKRWNGSAWVAVTDKVATDAAAAAANALSGLATKADASALQALDTRVTSTETTLTSQGQSITSLTNTVGTKNRTYRQASAPTTGLTVGDLWVNTTAGQNNKLSRWNGTTWDDTTDPRIPAAATAEALNSLSNTVTQQGNTLTSQGQSITSLTNSVSTADQKAVTAQQAAQDAATLAGSKGKVIVQSSAPATADRQAQNLWIDTTNNANTPKRWNGSAWVAVTDKVATDAAAAAANALSGLATKADASALQALDTRVTSTETTLTSQGQSITSLTNTVGTKNRTYRQASAPTTGLTVGDLWVNTTAGQNNKLSRWNGTTWDDTTDPRIPAAATAEALNSLSNTVTQQGNTLTSQGQSITSLTNRVTSAESVNTAQAGAISSLDTRVTSTEGQLSSQASRIDGISAQINPPLAGDKSWNAGATSVLAGVWSEQSARASEDMALGQRIDTVVAQVDQNAAAITAEQTARATADSALASQVETLSAKVNNDISAALQSEATARANADSALSSRIDTAQAKADDASAAVQTTATAQATTDGKLQAMYSVKLGVTSNGKYYAAGMGLGIENTPQGMQSQVLFQADRFAVINTANGVITTPFVIQGGQVFMNTAFIGDGTIDMAKISTALQSTNYKAGEQGWRLDKNGTFEINGSVAGQGRMQMTHRALKVFDGNDLLRVQIGDLDA